MQKTEQLLKKIISIIFILIIIKTAKSNNKDKSYIDTTMYVVYELCTDSTVLNCSIIRDIPDTYACYGLIPFNYKNKKVLYKNGYYMYSTGSNDWPVDSINYLGNKCKNKNNLIEWSDVQYNFDSILISMCNHKNMLYIKNKWLNRKLKKNGKKKKLLRKYPIDYTILRNRDLKLNFNRIYFIFKIKCRLLKVDNYSQERHVLYSNIFIRIKEIEIPCYYFINIYSLEPVYINR